MKRFDLFKRAVTAAAAVCFSITCFPAVYAEESDIPAGAVKIASAEDFAEFAESCVLDSRSLGKYYVLTEDIIIGENLTIPSFSGIFDGAGHTISGLKITMDGSEQGLFRYIEEDGIVKNLNVTGSVIPGGSASKCGGVAGVNRGRMISCRFSGIVKGSESCGGIAGLNEKSGLIVNCVCGGAVQARNLAGGITGENYGTVLHCENNSSVNTNAYDEPIDLESLNVDELYSAEQVADITDAGGIAGFSGGSVQGCVNNGSIGYPHVGYNIGGIAGRQDGYISACENYGTVNGRKDTAGIVGQAEPHFSLLFSERTLTRLRTQLEELNALIDTALTDVEAQSDIMSSDADGILDGLTDIRDGTDVFLDETDRIINANVDSINELSSRLSDLVDMAAPAADSFTEASDLLTVSMEQLAGSARLLDEAGDTAGEGMDILFPILDKLSEVTGNLTDAGNSVSSGLEALQQGLGDEEAMAAAIDGLSVDFRRFGNALSELSRTAADAAAALDGFTSSPEYNEAKSNIDSQLDDLSRISEDISQGLKNSENSFESIRFLIQSGVTDPKKYSIYIDDILNNFSDGQLSDLFECISSMVGSVSDIVTSEAAKELHDTMRQVTGSIPGQLENMGEAGQGLTENAGSISDNTDIRSIYDFIRYLKEANGELSDSADPVNDMIDAVREASDYFDEAGAAVVAAFSEASEAADKASQASDRVTDGFDQITAILDYFAGKEKVSFTGADESLIQSREELSGLTGSLIDLCGTFADNADGTVTVIAEDLRRINDKASEVRDTLMDLAEEMSAESKSLSDYAEDISSSDTVGRSDGKVAGCTNHGSINGDINVGGVAGSMAIDYDFDPEGDIETVGERSIDFMYQSKTVVRDCVNYGKIVSKKNGAGGIAGDMATGCLIGCAGLGDVCSTDGSYAGGVVGSSEAAVFGCSAKCRVSGASYVGGIAGEANDISSCRSFAVITDGSECIGAVAGSCTGDMSGNTFIDNGVGGVDGISYSGRAYPVDHSRMLTLDNVPRDFEKLTLTFIADDKVIDEIECGYGESIPESRLPEIPEREGCFAKWEDFSFSDVTFGAEINAVYTDYVTSLASVELRENGLPVIVAAGSFTDGDKLSVLNAGSGGYIDSDMWTVTVPDDGSETHTIRYLPAVNPEKAEVRVIGSDGIPQTAETVIDGSYLVFDALGNSFEISVTEKPSLVWLYIALGAAAAAAVIVIIFVRKKKNSKAK